jgi:hypothetical protein
LIGSGVSSSPSFATGNLLSERFTGSGTQNSWESLVSQGGGSWNADATTVTGTGFDGDHLTVSGTTDWQAQRRFILSADQSAIYIRFYLRVNSESWNDGDTEDIVTVVASGASAGSATYFKIKLTQVATDQLRIATEFNGDSTPGTGEKFTNISSGTTYRVEAKLVENGANDEWEWRVDGTSIGSRANSFLTGNVMRDVWVGMSYTNRAANISIDNVDVSSTGWLGE